MYYVQCEDIRVSSEGLEERYQNAYLLQVQYYLNRVIVKLVGIPKDIDIEKFKVAPERHGGKEYKMIKQLLMEETVYVKENGVEYKNPVRKVQKAAEGGGWQITGRKQESGNMAHFGYQILPRLFQDRCEGHNMTGARVGMMSGMKRIHEMQVVTGVKLMKVIKKGEEGMEAKDEEKTPQKSITQENKRINLRRTSQEWGTVWRK